MSYHYYQSKPGFNPQMQNTPKKGNGSDPKPGDNEKRRRQKTTAIALSVLLVLTTIVVGYQMISNSEETQVVLTNPVTINSSLTSLQESNKQQAEKIRNLKKQLFETNQKLYEFKTNLFAKGDPKEKTRLASLSHDLIEKSRTTEEFSTRIQELEQERQIFNQKINDMEKSVESLTEMTIVQRETKEQSIQSFQTQITELETQLSAERELLSNTTFELEDLRERSNQLSAELEAQYEAEIVFKNKIEEINANLADENTKNRTLEETIASLASAQKENEEHILSLEHQIAQSKEKLNQENTSLASSNEDMTTQYQELKKVLDTFIVANDNFYAENEKLQTQLRKETESTTQIKEDLHEALANYTNTQQRAQSIEQELLKTSQKVASLQEELSLQQTKLESKQQELDSIIALQNTQLSESNLKIADLENTIDGYQTKLHQRELDIVALTTKHEEGNRRLQELNASLNSASSTRNEDAYEALRAKIEEKEANIATLEQLLNDRSTELSLQNVERENAYTTIAKLNSTVEHFQNELSHKEVDIAALTALHQEEKKQLHNLNTSLQIASATKHQGDIEIVALRTQLEESAAAANSLQQLLNDQNAEMNDVMHKFQQVSESLENEKMHTRELHVALNNSLKENEGEQLKAMALQQQLKKNAGSLVFLQERLADKNMELEEKSNELVQLSKDLEQTISSNQQQIAVLTTDLNSLNAALEEEKQRTSTTTAEEQQKTDHWAQLAQQLEEKLAIHQDQLSLLNNQISDKENLIATLHQQYNSAVESLETEKQRTENAAASVTEEQQKADKLAQLAQQLEEKLAKQQDQLSLLNNQISDKENSIATLHQQYNSAVEALETEKQRTENAAASTVEVQQKADKLAQVAKQLEEVVSVQQEQLSLLNSEIDKKENTISSLQEKYKNATEALEAEKQKAQNSIASSAEEQQKTDRLKEEVQQNINELTALLKVLSNKEEEIISLQNITTEQKRTINELSRNVAENNKSSQTEKSDGF